MGAPWKQLDGVGGDGSSHSYRNRTSMLRLLKYVGEHDRRWEGEAEHVYVLKTMQRYNNEQASSGGNHLFRIATPEQTQDFGGVLGISALENEKTHVLKHIPYVAAGTFANLVYDQRETLLKHCPELKTIFPSLHEPTCFGAHPKPESCRQSICALQENIPSSGC